MKGKETIQIRFGNGLKKAMKAKSINLRQLANEADLEYAHVQRIATGKVNLELTTIIELASGLGMSPSDLLSFY
jgi:transcriptional regulator with XRE-family HTH domain